jgi:hypothetical protein
VKALSSSPSTAKKKRKKEQDKDFTHYHPFSISLEVLINTIRRKGSQGILTEKEKNKNVFAGDTIVCIENMKKLIKVLLELMSSKAR